MPARVFHGIEELRAQVGREIGLSDWIPVEQKMIDAFAAATGDNQWIHVDAERARNESPYGATIAHGFLTLALLSRLTAQAIEVRGDFKMRINYGLNRLRFPAPVPAGSRVRARVMQGPVEDVASGVQLVWHVTVEVEGSPKPAVAAEWLVRYYL